MRKISELALECLPLHIQASAEWQPTNVWYMVYDRLNDDDVLRRHIADLEWNAEDDVLVLTGHLPSFYLKQVLQTAVQNLPGIAQIDDQVHVESFDGLKAGRRAKQLTETSLAFHA